MKAVMLLWLAVCAVCDVRRGKIPNWLTLPVLAGALLWRLAHPAGYLWLNALLVMAGCLFLWQVHALGGGDVKVLLALTLLGLPFTAAALGGVVGEWLLLRLSGKRQARWPALPGMLAGVLGGLLL